MNGDKYSVTQYSISTILGFIQGNIIAIPEIQRPFVWKPRLVRDFIDSLYNGYPTGYLIIWQNPNVKLKDGRESNGKKILIDGQQRVTALMTSLLGRPVLNDDYDEKVIRIAFNPMAKEAEERFAVQTPAHVNSTHWIPDISKLFDANFGSYNFIEEYHYRNPLITKDDLSKVINKLTSMRSCQIGAIELTHDLDISQVTEIFVRINSQGKRLNEADFAMSKIAADEKYQGNHLRKAIDYFCHLAVKPSFFDFIQGKDHDFMKSEYFNRVQWLKDDNESIYDPDYGDVLRVSFMHKFGRGKLDNLVSLLSGRNFETQTFEEEIVEKSFMELKEGFLNFSNPFNFKNFVLALKSAGFISEKLTNSQMTLDFAYTLYLLLSSSNEIHCNELKKYVQKWYILSTLTSRYIGSPETMMDRDLRSIRSKGFLSFFKETEEAELSDAFWNVGLVQALETSAINSPYFNVFLASQVHASDRALFSSSIKVFDLISVTGDVHHIFPQKYLKENGITDKQSYNQVANYTYLDTQVNISIGKKAPSEYFKIALDQCKTGVRKEDRLIGTIIDEESFWNSMDANCIPSGIIDMTFENYEDFLVARRKLMAAKIRKYYLAI